MLLRKYSERFLYLSVILTLVLWSLPTFVSADDGLVSVFSGRGFRGSMEVVSKFNWLGMVMNFIISAFSILGLFMILYSRLISLLYLSNRPLFDNVNEIKKGSQGSFFGFPTLAKNVFNSNYGTGADAFVSFFYGLLPDVKKYSDYNPDKPLYNLSDEDNAAAYILKTAPSTVMLVFFFSIGFSGTLAKSYGTVVSAMTTAADAAVDMNLDKYVNKLIHSGNMYKFSLSADGSAKGKVQENISKSIYTKVIGKFEVLDMNNRNKIGAAVEKKVTELFNDKTIEDYVKVPEGKKVASIWDGLDYEIVDNSNGDRGTGEVISFADFIDNAPAEASKYYIHIYFSLHDVGPNYWTPEK